MPGRRRVHAGASFLALALRSQLEKAAIRSGSLRQKLWKAADEEVQHQRRLLATVGSPRVGAVFVHCSFLKKQLSIGSN